MSVVKLCEICKSAPVEATCTRCGQLVCETHYDESTGFCVECVAEIGGDPENVPDDLPDDVDTYEF